MSRIEADVIVIGAGNAAFCAAFAAQERGASVCMFERAPEDECGGNSRFTAGAVRYAYNGVDDVRQIMPDLSNDEIANTDFGSYSEDEFFDDMFRVTQYRTDADLCERLVRNSFETMKWLKDRGMRFQPSYGRQAFKIDGRFRFWGGLCTEFWGGGPGIIEEETRIARECGIRIEYATRVLSLIYDGSAVTGVRVKRDGEIFEVSAKAVVIAAGGFEANHEWRTRYLGPGWDLAKVRGSRFNTGDGIRMALDIGAAPYGNWSGCHAVGWDRNAPEFGDLAVGDNFQKHSYPLGIMVNATGRRFVDEGADFRNYTYAKYGHVILNQPEQFAWQIFDAKVLKMLRDEYRIREVTKVSANTLDELADKLDGVDKQGFLAEIEAYNNAVMTDVGFDPTVKDGRGTKGLAVPKSNWANVIDEPPFEAYQVTCGITFTFGGLRIQSDTAQVLDVDLAPIPGLYAAGELIGGLFYFNYPGGTGLMSGAVFGRTAGDAAGRATR